MTDAMVELPLDRLHAHPRNSNVMPGDLFDKLVKHIAASDRYPPLIVRPAATGAYQILDGHHRAAALRRLGRADARCVVWDVDDAEALLLLATLNRLQGEDDPRKRGVLLDELMHQRREDLSALAAALPESTAQVARLRRLAAPPPRPRPPQALEDMPVAVHFFLLPAQRRELEARLRTLGGQRETALMTLVAAGP